MLRFEDGTVRYMTIHEAKLIQTFPADFNVTGSWGEALRQIGNAVPVKLAETVGRHLHELLRNNPTIKDGNFGNMVCTYPEALNGEQMLLAMESPSTYSIDNHRQKRKRVYA